MHDANAQSTGPTFLAAVRRGLAPGGALAIWSADEAPALEASLREVYGDVAPAGVRRRSARPGRDVLALRRPVPWGHEHLPRRGRPHRARLDGRGPGAAATHCGARRPSGRSRTSRSRAPRSSPPCSAPWPRVKAAAATANEQLDVLTSEQAQAIRDAAAEIVEGGHVDAFPIDVFQTGSGTSSNMNMNEVLATLAGRGRRRHPSQRPGQRQPVQQRHVPDLDPRRRGRGDDRRPGARPGVLATSLEAKATEFDDAGEVRPHPPDGRHPGHAGPGVRRLRGRRTTRDRAARGHAPPGARAAARRHRGGHRHQHSRRLRRRRRSPPLADEHRPGVHRGPQPLRGPGRRATPWSS